MRFGELSRAPLRLLRFEMCGGEAKCEWMARPPDLWDGDLPSDACERNEALQALQDAIQVRELLFRALPEVQSVQLRVYRQSGPEPPELVITGTVSRDEEPPVSIRSLVMRAKLYGLRFFLDDGLLKALQTQEQLELAT